MPVDKDVGHTLSRKLGGSDSGHVPAAAKTVGDKQDAGVTPGRGRQCPNIVHTDRDT